MQRFADLFKKQVARCQRVYLRWVRVRRVRPRRVRLRACGAGAGRGRTGGDGAETAKSPRSTWLRKAAVLVLNYIVHQKPQATTANLTAALTAAVAKVTLQQAFSLQTDWDWLDSGSVKTTLLNTPPKNYGRWTTHRGKALLAHPILIGGPTVCPRST